ncbi:MAG: hypothetical protein NC930_09475 [Candidatus Omnitrophica bacterium]|nr:hypothetical protein [Candidatus Omnitrophota bacterium]
MRFPSSIWWVFSFSIVFFSSVLLADTGPPEVRVPKKKISVASKEVRSGQTVQPAFKKQPAPGPDITASRSKVHGAKISSESSQESVSPERNLFVEQFYVPPDLRVKYKTWESNEFVFVETPSRERQTRYSVVTDFGKNILKTQYFSGINEVQDARKWLEDHLETSDFQGVEIRRLPVPKPQGGQEFLYWVGHKAFDSAEEAQAQIALIQSVVEAGGGDFARMVKQARSYIRVPEETLPVEIKTPAQYAEEEKIMLKFLDQLDVGNELFGPFQGVGQGEKILWQSFGEMSWRDTNLDKKNFSDVVGYWTNRLVFKGIRAPLSTIDPFVEATTALESNGNDGGSHLDLSAGLEWRPLSRNAWLLNFRPWSLPLLEWIRSYKLYVQYFDRKNIKGEIANIRDYDIRAGAQIYYEWGIDLPPSTEGPAKTFPDFLRRYSWGEYYGDYGFRTTNFSTEDDFDSCILNSSVILGIHLPGIPLPPNPMNQRLSLMPYMRFEHVNNTEFPYSYDNRYFVAAGVRWMPFRDYRFKENEWLSKFKIFAEYIGVGKVNYIKQEETPPSSIRHDLRFGVAISERRF